MHVCSSMLFSECASIQKMFAFSLACVQMENQKLCSSIAQSWFFMGWANMFYNFNKHEFSAPNNLNKCWALQEVSICAWNIRNWYSTLFLLRKEIALLYWNSVFISPLIIWKCICFWFQLICIEYDFRLNQISLIILEIIISENL